MTSWRLRTSQKLSMIWFRGLKSNFSISSGAHNRINALSEWQWPYTLSEFRREPFIKSLRINSTRTYWDIALKRPAKDKETWKKYQLKEILETYWLLVEGSAVFKPLLILPLLVLRFTWLRKRRALAGIWPSLTRPFPLMTAPCEYSHPNWSRSAGIQI